MKRFALHLMSPLAALTLGACEGALLTTDSTIDEGNAALLEQRPEDAERAYTEAATSLPESPELNYVRGLATSALGRHEDAQAFLMRALATKDKALEQRVKAALGLAYARQALALEKANTNEKGELADPKPSLERWQHAVSFLEEALGLDPTDLLTRRNLEVALMRVDPPCHSRDDAYEDNDTPEKAATLELTAEEATASEGNPQLAQAQKDQTQDLVKFREQLFSCPDDEDHYKVELQPGDRVEFKLTTPKEAGAISVELFAPDGSSAGQLLANASSTFIRVAPNQGGAWRLAQRNLDFEELSYSLEIKRRPACSATEDHLEDNDTLAQARTLTPGALPGLKACPGDDDYYALTLAEGESLFLAAQPQPKANSEGDKKQKDAPQAPLVELELLHEDGTLLSRGAPSGEGRLAALLTPGPGRYLIRVASAQLSQPSLEGDTHFEGRYDLNAHIMPPCPEGNDGYEPNNSFAEATDFSAVVSQTQAQAGQGQTQGSPQVFARLCPGDTDWWSFSVTEAKPSIASILFDHDKGDLDLRLWDEQGREVLERAEASTSDINGESVPLPHPEEGDSPDAPVTPKGSKLEIFAKNEGENFYILKLDQPQGGGDGDSSDSDENQEEQDEQDQQDEQSEQEQDPKDEQPSDSEQLKDLLDKLDRNPENLPARDAAKQSPLSNQKPLKDW